MSKAKQNSRSSTQEEIYGIECSFRKEDPKSNNLSFHPRKLQKEKQYKPQASRRKEIVKIRAEVNEIENNKTMQKINKPESQFFEKINKVDKIPARLTKKKKERRHKLLMSEMKEGLSLLIPGTLKRQ